jgi:hypothetical protein
LVFDYTVAYGLSPGRAIGILFALIPVFALIYIVLIYLNFGSLYLYKPYGSLELSSDNKVSALENPKVQSIESKSRYHKIWFSIHFSIVSAFYIGWRDFNIGGWITRLQRQEYTIRSLGLVRALSGAQSLVGVFLLALALAAYFDQLFR